MDIKPNSMTDSMSKVLAIAGCFDHITWDFIKITEAKSIFCSSNQGLIGFQNGFINFSFLVADMSSIDGPCHIADIVVIQATKIKGQGISCWNHPITWSCVWHGRAFTCCWDNIKRYTRSSQLPHSKIEENRCFQLCRLPYLDIIQNIMEGLVRDATSFFNGRNLRFIFNQAQFHHKVR